MDTINIDAHITDPDLTPPNSAFAFLNKYLIYIVLTLIIIALVIYLYFNKKPEPVQEVVINKRAPLVPKPDPKPEVKEATPKLELVPLTEEETTLIDKVESNIAPIVEINDNEDTVDD